MNKLLSIVVPIKNGYEYLKSIIDKVEELDTDILELIIHDNTEDNRQIIDILKNYNCKNIKYYHQIEPLSMVQNFEKGIYFATGKYLCILGADDNITSKIIDVAKYMDENGIESAVFKEAFYNWPDMKFRAHQNRPSLTIYKSRGHIKEINIENEFQIIMQNGCISLGKLPEPYHGIILRECLEKVKEISGTYIPAGCPDMAMAISLSQVVKKHVFIDAPITLSGQSFNSAGGKGARGEHKGDLKNKSFLPLNVEETWPSFIPRLWTGPSIYADSMYNALKEMRQETKLSLFNKEMNYANIISFFPEYIGIVKPFMDEGYKQKLRVAKYSIRIFVKRLFFYIKNWTVANLRISINKVYYNVNSSLEAANLVDEYIDTMIKGVPYLRS